MLFSHIVGFQIRLLQEDSLSEGCMKQRAREALFFAAAYWLNA
jgi:hypothetical protein